MLAVMMLAHYEIRMLERMRADADVTYLPVLTYLRPRGAPWKVCARVKTEDMAASLEARKTYSQHEHEHDTAARQRSASLV